jgi:hypothetical protein
MMAAATYRSPTRRWLNKDRVMRQAAIAAGTVLEVKVPDSGEVTFAGPTGTLWLDHASTFAGKVEDFGAQDGIDFPGIPRPLRSARVRPRAIGRPCTVSGTAFAEAGAKDLGR